MKTRLMQAFPDMAAANYPHEVFVERALQNYHPNYDYRLLLIYDYQNYFLNYPHKVFVERAVQNGSLSTGWCEG